MHLNAVVFQESRVREILHAPVVPAGVISLRRLMTSTLFETSAFLAKQRISCLVWQSGFSREDWSNWKLSFN